MRFESDQWPQTSHCEMCYICIWISSQHTEYQFSVYESPNLSKVGQGQFSKIYHSQGIRDAAWISHRSTPSKKVKPPSRAFTEFDKYVQAVRSQQNLKHEFVGYKEKKRGFAAGISQFHDWGPINILFSRTRGSLLVILSQPSKLQLLLMSLKALLLLQMKELERECRSLPILQPRYNSLKTWSNRCRFWEKLRNFHILWTKQTVKNSRNFSRWLLVRNLRTYCIFSLTTPTPYNAGRQNELENSGPNRLRLDVRDDFWNLIKVR